jgi:hypothetical protein
MVKRIVGIILLNSKKKKKILIFTRTSQEFESKKPQTV